jgi:hypothetical protein
VRKRVAEHEHSGADRTRRTGRLPGGYGSRSMGRALTAVGVLLALFLLGFGLLVFLTRTEDGVAIDNLLSENLTKEIQLAEGRGEPVIDFAEQTDFAWDRLCITPASTPKETIDAELGFEFKGDTHLLNGVLLIFADRGELARFADYRGEGRFEGIEEPVACFDRERAAFRIRDLVLTPSRP